MGRPRMRLEDRLKDKFIPEPMSGCWLWVGACDRHGYGLVGIWHGGWSTQERAHRVSWSVHRGEVGDAWVLHRCDTPACINPDHLYLGTPADNARDRVERGRQRSGSMPGESHPSAFLTWAKVAHIRAQAADGVVLREIAEEHGVSHRTVCDIISGKTWKDGDCRPIRRRPRLRKSDVESIRRESLLGFTQREIAERHGVDQSTVSRISRKEA